MRYATMSRYFRLLEGMGAIRRVGEAPVDARYGQLVRMTPQGPAPAVRILYEAAAAPDDPTWNKVWYS